MLAFVVSLWISILHRGLFDPALALRRGAGVVALGVVLTALFVAVEGAASSLIVTQLGMPSASGPIVAGTAVAIGFQPLRARVERGVQSAMLKLLPPEAVAEGERREQAVLFADLSGYSRLAESDETEALTLAAILHRHAHVVAAEQGGRVVKTIGDAVLCLFDDPAQAMAAAIALQQGYRDEAARRDLEPLPVHAGLHAGEVVIARGGDVFGANVNLAARLLNLAGADELVATQSVATAAVAVGLVVESLPARRFKNIAEPVDCLRIRLDLA
jgi:class 3 adenylate cyclase